MSDRNKPWLGNRQAGGPADIPSLYDSPTPQEVIKARRVHATITCKDPVQESKERYESWLYEAVERFERADPALRADYPFHDDRNERINRALCRLLERMIERQFAGCAHYPDRCNQLEHTLGELAPFVDDLPKRVL
jgi:hypothetical protein